MIFAAGFIVQFCIANMFEQEVRHKSPGKNYTSKEDKVFRHSPDLLYNANVVSPENHSAPIILPSKYPDGKSFALD
jgi:hypothetical protein